MESKLLELARAVVNDCTSDCAWLLLKNEVERLDSQTTYTPQGEFLQFKEPCKPLAYQVEGG